MADDEAKRPSRPSTPLESLYTEDERKIMDDVKASPSPAGAATDASGVERDEEGKAGGGTEAATADSAVDTAPTDGEGGSVARGTIVGSAFDAYLAARWTALLGREGIFRSKVRCSVPAARRAVKEGARPFAWHRTHIAHYTHTHARDARRPRRTTVTP